MKFPEIPANEDQRLEELSALEIMDTEPEQSFDDLTALASGMCGVPIALLCLVDQSRQWFKSSIGLDAKETPREISFCGHAINSREIFEVSDATLDERFRDNPLVVGGPLVRFYAGVPLVTKHGNALGTLCVIDRKSMALTPAQRLLLAAIGRQVIRLFEMRQARMEVESALARSARREMEFQKVAEQLSVAQHLSKIGSWEFNLTSSSMRWSDEHYRIFEISRDKTHEELYGLYRQRLHPDDLMSLDSILIKAKAGKSDDEFVFDQRVVLDVSRAIKFVRVIGRLIIDKYGEKNLVGTCQDISIEVSMKAAIEEERAKSLQSSKLASLGEMAAGVAHEINNPLTIIRGSLQMIEKHPEEKEKYESRMQAALDATRRIEKIVLGLRKFSRTSERGSRVEKSIKQNLPRIITGDDLQI